MFSTLDLREGTISKDKNKKQPPLFESSIKDGATVGLQRRDCYH